MRQLLKDALFALAAPTSTSGGRDHRKRAWDDAACESIGHDHSKAAQKRGGGSQQLNKGSLQPNQESKASSSRTAAEQRSGSTLERDDKSHAVLSCSLLAHLNMHRCPQAICGCKFD